ncbi:glycoside hydrolase family 28 protein [Aulographum hederae CBS 113979]|uniref:Glycoside hydrolase family 28 protein n=1 Tax=Aulographum hederae CBS 113979 TaxID=1176131 RepID=A0A6G1GL98_9PEZI|nr:glycoside hydrolase family 28 protein [Aulographum hederae CBS 113979]
MHSSGVLAALLVLPTLAFGQLSGRVGPTTSTASKRAKKICDVTRFGATPTGDIGPALTRAWNECKTGGVVFVPEGNFQMSTWVSLSGGTGVGIQIDGIITRKDGSDKGGNMILVQRSNDVEFFSGNGRGAFQGKGYEMHREKNIMGPRILRFVRVDNFAVHDFIMVDAPSFHFSMDTCKNGEVYNLVVRGGNQGGLDGIDVWSDNVHIHDVEVTNKDECVCVKSPAHNILIENIYCNWSGGSSIGSLGEDVDVSDIVFRNVYTTNSNQMMMIKSWGGSGSLKNVLFDNFIGHANAYGLNVDQYWSPMKQNPGPGVKLDNITFSNWKGTVADGMRRSPIRILCSTDAPCTSMVVENVSLWTDAGTTVTNECKAAYGTGACLRANTDRSFNANSAKTSISRPPPRYQAVKMDSDLPSDFGTTQPIPIPKIPASFFPGTKPLKPVAGSGAAAVPAAAGGKAAGAKASGAQASGAKASGAKEAVVFSS